jgi:hypothetical protein
MERWGVPLFNPPRTLVQGFMLTDLFESLRQAGFSVPAMVSTNDRETAVDFVEWAGHALWRPVTGRASWQLFSDKQREHLLASGMPPVLLAELVDGPVIRAYLFDGQPLLCLKRYAPATAPVERLEVVEGFECGEVISELLDRVAKALTLRWGQVTFVLKDDEAWLYDVDPDPLYDWLPERYLERVTEGLAMGLLNGRVDLDALPALPDVRQQSRPTIFLRRMLASVFELEHMKYQPSPGTENSGGQTPG